MPGSMSITRVAVTGGAGRLGQTVVAILAKHFEVTVIDKSFAESGGGQSIDVLDSASLARALIGQDAVVHLAAIDASINATDRTFFETNTVAAWSVLDTAFVAGIRRFVVCSSTGVYGFSHNNRVWQPNYLPVDEAHPCRPATAYGMSKQVTEVIARNFSRRPDMSVTVLRPCFIAFPNLLPQMLAEHEARGHEEATKVQTSEMDWIEPLPIARAWLDPQDAANCFHLALISEHKGYRVFNVCADDSFVSEPTLEYLADALGTLPEQVDERRFKVRPRASLFDNSRALTELGWRPKTTWPDIVKHHQCRIGSGSR